MSQEARYNVTALWKIAQTLKVAFFLFFGGKTKALQRHTERESRI